mmetsp:Transcript_26546/g.82030  ORF Transcript_26546/g.82030 Transcript_26546/m.82030 type:complete len:1550 (-) Transcript_26546:191-4840(-)
MPGSAGDTAVEGDSGRWAPTHEVVAVHTADRISIAKLPPANCEHRLGWTGDVRHWEEVILTDVRPFSAVPFNSNGNPSAATGMGGSGAAALGGNSPLRQGSLTTSDLGTPLAAGAGPSANDTNPGSSLAYATHLVSAASAIQLDAPMAGDSPFDAAAASGSSHDIASSSPASEPHGVEARDYVRKHFLGKRVQVDRSNPSNPRFVVVYRERDGLSPATLLVKQGLAAVRPAAVRAPPSEWTTALIRNEADARTHRRGMYSLRPLVEAIRRVRKFPLAGDQRQAIGFFGTPSTASPVVNAQQHHHRHATNGATAADAADGSKRLSDDDMAHRDALVATIAGHALACSVEDISDAGVLRLVTTSSAQEVFLRLAGVFVFTSAPFAELRAEAVATLRAAVLHRTFVFDLSAFDAKSGCFIGGFDSQCSALEWLVSHGRIALDRRTVGLLARRTAFENHERLAASETRGVWAAALVPHHPQFFREALPFAGTVVGVMSARTLLVLPDGAPADGPAASDPPRNGPAPRLVHTAFIATDEPRPMQTLDVGDVVQHTARYLDGRDFARSMLLGRRVEVQPITVVPARVPGSPSAVIASVNAEPPSAADTDGAIDVAEALAFAGVCDLDRVHLAPLALAISPPLPLVSALESGNAARAEAAAAAASGSAPATGDAQPQRHAYEDSRPVGISETAAGASGGRRDGGADDESSDGDEISPHATESFGGFDFMRTLTSDPCDLFGGMQLTNTDPVTSGSVGFGPIGGGSAGATAAADLAPGGPVQRSPPAPDPLPPPRPQAQPPVDEGAAAASDPSNAAASSPPPPPTTHDLLYARADRTALRRLELPEAVPLAASVEQVDVVGRLLWLHIVPLRVVIPATLAGVVLPQGHPEVASRLRSLLHTRVDAVLCGVAGNSIAVMLVALAPSKVAPAAGAPTPPPAPVNINQELLATGCGLARALHLLPTPDDVRAFHEAESLACTDGHGIWGETDVERTAAFIAGVDGNARPLVEPDPMPPSAPDARMPRTIPVRGPGTLSNCRLVGANPEHGTLLLEDTAGFPGVSTPAELRERLRRAANAVPNYQLDRLSSPTEALGHLVVVAGPVVRGAAETTNADDIDVEWLRARVAGTPDPEYVELHVLDTPERGVVHLRHVYFLDERRFTEWRQASATATAPSASKKPNRGNKKAAAAREAEGPSEWKAMDASAAEAMALLVDTPPLVFEARVAFVEIDRRTERVDALLDRLAPAGEDAPLPRAELVYVRYGIPYVNFYSSEERRCANHPPFAMPLLHGTCDDEVFVDVSLLDVPTLVDSVTRLRMEPRQVEVPPAADQSGIAAADGATGALSPMAPGEQRRVKGQRNQGVRGKRVTAEVAARPPARKSPPPPPEAIPSKPLKGAPKESRLPKSAKSSPAAVPPSKSSPTPQPQAATVDERVSVRKVDTPAAADPAVIAAAVADPPSQKKPVDAMPAKRRAEANKPNAKSSADTRSAVKKADDAATVPLPKSRQAVPKTEPVIVATDAAASATPSNGKVKGRKADQSRTEAAVKDKAGKPADTWENW